MGGHRLAREEWQEAQARGIAKKQQAPWLSVDDKMLQAVEVHMSLGLEMGAPDLTCSPQGHLLTKDTKCSW